MELLLLIKIFLALGSILYMLLILKFIKSHMPKVEIRSTKKEKKKGKKKDEQRTDGTENTESAENGAENEP